MELDPKTFRLSGTEKLSKALLIIGVIALIISFIGLAIPDAREQFFYSSLTSWTYWMTFGFGALFFVLLHHLVGATWSIVLRRIVETVMVALPIMLIFAIIPLFGLDSLYSWSSGDPSTNHLLATKTWWLNTPFFVVRTIIYVVVLYFLTRFLYKQSLKQDSGHSQSLTDRLRRVSAPGMVIFGLILTFITFDYLMSLDYKWYSTIFGVYIFAGSVVAILSFTTLVALFLRSRGMLEDSITIEHYHDLGKLIFAFLVFWAYIAFSQFFLIWYGNIPEETDWYLRRFEGSWATWGWVILFGHFFLPFLLLLSRVTKRNTVFLGIMALWMLVMHWVDLHWVIMPTLHESGVTLSWLDFSTLIGIGGIFMWYFTRQLASHPVIPVRDPQLEESMHFTNV